MKKTALKNVLVKAKNANYYYNIWFLHLTKLFDSGCTRFPRVVAEIGPGTGIGVGLAALLSGADKYYALDVVRHTNIRENVLLLDQLVTMFRHRVPRPEKVWPDFDHLLGPGLFPHKILKKEQLSMACSPRRVEQIRRALMGEDPQGIINYLVPWDSLWSSIESKLDLILSQSVMEHVTYPDDAYQIMSLLLSDSGWISHYVDLKSHGLTNEWNGHWAIPPKQWKTLLGSTPYLLNRWPSSAHKKSIQDCGFRICREEKMSTKKVSLKRIQLTEPWRSMPSEDRKTSALFIQASKLAPEVSSL